MFCSRLTLQHSLLLITKLARQNARSSRLSFLLLFDWAVFDSFDNASFQSLEFQLGVYRQKAMAWRQALSFSSPQSTQATQAKQNVCTHIRLQWESENHRQLKFIQKIALFQLEGDIGWSVVYAGLVKEHTNIPE